MSSRNQMPASLKNRWLKALRSGRYKQTAGALRRRTEEGDLKYCCLGVLCNVAGENWKETNRYFFDEYAANYGYDSTLEATGDPTIEEGLLDARHRRKFGLTNNTCYRLMRMNDNGKSFREIADVIEKSVKTKEEVTK